MAANRLTINHVRLVSRNISRILRLMLLLWPLCKHRLELMPVTNADTIKEPTVSSPLYAARSSGISMKAVSMDKNSPKINNSGLKFSISWLTKVLRRRKHLVGKASRLRRQTFYSLRTRSRDLLALSRFCRGPSALHHCGQWHQSLSPVAT